MAKNRKLGRNSSHRRAMLRNLVTSLLAEGRKRGDLHARRQALAYIYSEDVVTKLFTEYAEKYADRNGGYTRVLKMGPRRGDGAEISIIELV